MSKRAAMRQIVMWTLVGGAVITAYAAIDTARAVAQGAIVFAVVVGVIAVVDTILHIGEE